MSELAFYRQKRYDHGFRMGVEKDGFALLEHFEGGTDPSYQDHPLGSGLLWYVDIRCTLEDAPEMAEPARSWFVDHELPIVNGLRQLADLVIAGFDDPRPLEWQIPPEQTDGVEIQIVCSCINRLRGLDIASVFRDIADRWIERLMQLEPVTTSISR